MVDPEPWHFLLGEDRMNFTSFHFVVFFFVTLLVGHFLKNKSQRLFLLVASYYFYGVFEPFYLVLIFFSTIWDYFSGLGILSAQMRERGEVPTGSLRYYPHLKPKLWIIGSLCVNITLLAYFKYTNFGLEVVNDALPWGDTIFALPMQNILLPVGISFYTFQSMSYTIDVYRGTIPARKNFIDFALYVAFFPQLVAGPIVRSPNFFGQLDKRLPVLKDDIVIGTTRIVVGFFRKLVLSDNLALMVNDVFANPFLHPLDVWVGAIGFGFQIYLDFAGYTDIARGVARLFGFEFEVNFLYPMAAKNITDHWQRWHLSLTTWLRDYVFIPLGGSRGGTLITYRNIFLVWLFAGIWHGPAYHFIAWGVWQFVMIAIHREYSGTALHSFLNEKGGIAYSILSRIITMFFLTFGFIWFRADNLVEATRRQAQLFGFGFFPEKLTEWWHGKSFSDIEWLGGLVPTPIYKSYVVLLLICFAYEYFFNRFQLEYFWKPENKNKLVAVLTMMVFCILTLSSPESPSFIYFQF